MADSARTHYRGLLNHLYHPGRALLNIPVLIAILFAVVVLIAVMLGKIPFMILLAYLGLSVVTFLLYWFDKSAARKGRWRIKESTLHLFALIGGWPGATIAQQILRHKTRKQSFRRLYWGTVLLNCCFLFWLYVATG